MSSIIEPHFVNDMVFFLEHVFVAIVGVVLDFDGVLVENSPFTFALSIVKLLVDILDLFLILGCSILVVDAFEICAWNVRKRCRLNFFEKVLYCLFFVL